VAVLAKPGDKSESDESGAADDYDLHCIAPLRCLPLRSFGGEVQGFSPLDAAAIRETITQGPGQGEYERFR